MNALTNLHDSDHTTTRSTVGSNITLDVGDGNIPTALLGDASNSHPKVADGGYFTSLNIISDGMTLPCQ
ncbi:hypothetical protein KRX11_02365 [Pasteurellaceae bacterium TAE3-ERU1]|nr:hypothetical protein [Pasteurellaceae bacterium TAE3-ERU1]